MKIPKTDQASQEQSLVRQGDSAPRQPAPRLHALVASQVQPALRAVGGIALRAPLT
jgi:hypothetical protein